MCCSSVLEHTGLKVWDKAFQTTKILTILKPTKLLIFFNLIEKILFMELEYSLKAAKDEE